MSTDPPRWVDDPSIPDALRADLRAAREVPPVELPPNAPPPPGPALTPWVVGGLLLLGAGWAAWPSHATPTGETPTESRSSSSTASESEREETPTPADPRADVEPDSPTAPVPAPQVEIVESPEPPPRAPAPEPTLQDEIAHMATLRRVAQSDPGRALAMARAGERRFRRGLFGEEREAVIVLSLARLGRPSAVSEARSFLRRHPRSTFAASIQEISASGEGSGATHQREPR